MSAEIRIKGSKELQRKLEKVKDAKVLKPAMEAATVVIQDAAASYPPYSAAWRRGGRDFSSVRPGSTYVRTGTLGKSWRRRVRAVTKSVLGTVFTKLDYAPLVQSARSQAWMHKKWWMTDEAIAKREEKFITKLFEAVLKKEIR